MTGPVLELRHLQMISAIGRTGRVVDAADELGLTPSALSHRIREAERRLGVPLFERLHKRLRMTAAAEYLADVSTRMLHDLEQVEHDVRRMNMGIEHVVRIAVEAYSSYHWLPDFLGAHGADAPYVDIQVMAGAGMNTLHALLNRNVDLVIASGDYPRPGTLAMHLFVDPLVLICAPEHALASKDAIDATDIEDQDFITFAKVPEPDREFARLFRAKEKYPRWTATVELPEAIVELVAAGQGTSILANWAMRPHATSGRIVTRSLAGGGISIPWFALTRDDEPDAGPVAQTAHRLVKWCRANGGLF
ncbi:MAG: LysR family transcriptional regulator [Pseudomonadota bacterium]